MRRRLTILAALLALSTPLAAPQAAWAQDNAQSRDPIGDLISSALTAIAQAADAVMVKATLYHTGAKGVGTRDSLGCQVVAMRTAAVAADIPRHTLLFTKETVGLTMPDGKPHDGYWYASDRGGAIKGARIDLFTGDGRGSMAALAKLNQAVLTVIPVGTFDGCPKN